MNFLFLISFIFCICLYYFLFPAFFVFHLLFFFLKVDLGYWFKMFLFLIWAFMVWGCRTVWCTLTSWYLVSHLPVSMIHVSDIFLVGFWSWEINFIMWGCQGWGWQAAGTWVLVSVKWWDSPPPSGDLEPANQYAPSKKPTGELKSPRAPKFEQKPGPFVPIELI